MNIRKKIVTMGLVILISGTVLASFSTQESYTEENILDEWDSLGPSTVGPDLGPSWTLAMPEQSYFQLNVSASGVVRVRVGTPAYDEYTGVPSLTNLIFNQVGTRFTQNVSVATNSTYQVEVRNEETIPVDL